MKAGYIFYLELLPDIGINPLKLFVNLFARKDKIISDKDTEDIPK